MCNDLCEVFDDEEWWQGTVLEINPNGGIKIKFIDDDFEEWYKLNQVRIPRLVYRIASFIDLHTDLRFYHFVGEGVEERTSVKN